MYQNCGQFFCAPQKDSFSKIVRKDKLGKSIMISLSLARLSKSFLIDKLKIARLPSFPNVLIDEIKEYKLI